MADISNKVFLIFQDIFSAPADVDRSELIYNEYPGWDSVGHMTLIAGLETEFDCMLEMEQILDMSSFDKSVEIMAGYNE